MQAALGGVAFCASQEKTALILTGGEISAEWLLEQVSQIQQKAGQFVVFDLKNVIAELPIENRANCFDATVAAYLLNPLKSDYMYEDVAREARTYD